MGIGQRIKIRREELGWSQEELAKKLGYKSRSTIAKIESGENEITQSKIMLFSKILDTPTKWLLECEDEDQGEVNQKEKSLLQSFRQLNEKGKDKAIEAVSNLTYNPVYCDDYLAVIAAHKRTDIDVTDEMIQHDDDIMMSDDF